MLRAKERTRTPYLFVAFTFGLIVEYIKEFGGALSIVVILIYFKILWLKMANVKSLHQSLVTILMNS
jgi:hypothetical protein